MATLVGKFCRVGYSQQFASGIQRVPSVMWRCLSNADTAGSGGSKKTETPSPAPTASKQTTPDASTYKVQEYFSYNDYSYYDLENEIDASGRRQIQPDPQVGYNHTDPWKKREKKAA